MDGSRHRHRQRLRLPDFDYSDPHYVIFATPCARHLGRPFAHTGLAVSIVDALLFYARNGRWHLYAYCLMPDHLHLALSPEHGAEGLPRLMQGFKSYTTRLAWQTGHAGALWQRSYYDHVARKGEDVWAICDYILANPVRKGLVVDARDWPYSRMAEPLPG